MTDLTNAELRQEVAHAIRCSLIYTGTRSNGERDLLAADAAIATIRKREAAKWQTAEASAAKLLEALEELHTYLAKQYEGVMAPDHIHMMLIRSRDTIAAAKGETS